MPSKIKPSGKQKTYFFLHMIVFVVVSLILFATYDLGQDGWAYPWHAWIIAAWGLGLIGHGCLVFTSYEDKGFDTYVQQNKHG